LKIKVSERIKCLLLAQTCLLKPHDANGSYVNTADIGAIKLGGCFKLDRRSLPEPTQ